MGFSGWSDIGCESREDWDSKPVCWHHQRRKNLKRGRLPRLISEIGFWTCYFEISNRHMWQKWGLFIIFCFFLLLSTSEGCASLSLWLDLTKRIGHRNHRCHSWSETLRDRMRLVIFLAPDKVINRPETPASLFFIWSLSKNKYLCQASGICRSLLLHYTHIIPHHPDWYSIHIEKLQRQLDIWLWSNGGIWFGQLVKHKCY